MSKTFDFDTDNTSDHQPIILKLDYSTFFSWTALGILLKFALCHFDDYDDYLEHFQLLTSI